MLRTDYQIDMLDKSSVSIRQQRYIMEDGVEYTVGDPHRCAYMNTESGRAKLESELPEPYLSAVLTVWGETPNPEVMNVINE